MTIATHVGLAVAALVLLEGGAHAQQIRLGSVYGSLDYVHWSVKAAPRSVPLVSTGPESVFNGFPAELQRHDCRLRLARACGGRTRGAGLQRVQRWPAYTGLRHRTGPRTGWRRADFGLKSRQATFIAGGDGSAANGIRVPFYNAVPYFINVPIHAIPSENGLPVALPNRIGGAGQGHQSAEPVGARRGRNLRPPARPELGRHWPGRNSRISTLPRTSRSGTISTAREGPLSARAAPCRTISARPTASSARCSESGPRPLGDGSRLRRKFDWRSVPPSRNSRSTARSRRSTTRRGSRGTRDFRAAQQLWEPLFRGLRGGAGSIQVKLGYDLTSNLRLTLGYDVLYLSNVIRPTDQIDRNIPKGNVFGQGGTVTTTGYPARLFRTTDFYAQGLNAGRLSASRRNDLAVGGAEAIASAGG